MRRRDKPRSKAVKTPRQMKLTRHAATEGPSTLASGRETEVAQLIRERDEALEQ